VIALYTGIATLIRFLVGCIIFFAIVQQSHAEKLVFRNYCDTNCIVLRDNVEILARPGVTEMEWPTANSNGMEWALQGTATNFTIYAVTDAWAQGEVEAYQDSVGAPSGVVRERWTPYGGFLRGMVLGLTAVGFFIGMRFIRGIYRQSPEALG